MKAASTAHSLIVPRLARADATDDLDAPSALADTNDDASRGKEAAAAKAAKEGTATKAAEEASKREASKQEAKAAEVAKAMKAADSAAEEASKTQAADDPSASGDDMWNVCNWIHSLDLSARVAAALDPALPMSRGDRAFEATGTLTQDVLRQLLTAAGLPGLLDELWAGVCELKRQAAPSGKQLNAKFSADGRSFFMAEATLDTFFRGLEGLVGPPKFVDGSLLKGMCAPQSLTCGPLATHHAPPHPPTCTLATLQGARALPCARQLSPV